MKRVNPRILSLVAVLFLARTVYGVAYEFSVSLSGPAESPPNNSPGTGTATVIYDATAHTLFLDVDFQDLEGTTTAAHIHGPTAVPWAGTAGVATQTPSFVGFPLGVTGGSYASLFDLTDPASYRAGFITANGGTVEAAEAALAAAMHEGRAYLNLHTTSYPGGEIRGFLKAVPDAGATAGMLGVGLLGLAGLSRHRRLAA